MFKRILKIGLWSLLAIYLIVMIVYISGSSKSTVCKSVKVVVEDASDYGFLAPAEIERAVKAKFPRLIGSNVNKLQLETIESYVKRWKTVKTCAVYQTITGVLTISVTQREPVARVFSMGRSFYIDDQGNEFPSSFRYASRVIVVNGTIGALKSYDDLLQLVHFIADDSFWRAQIVQISVDSNGDFVLVPRVGSQVIVFGSIEDMEYKFKTLLGFYKTALEPREWEMYSKINVKYKGQVVCTKRG